MQVQQHLVNVAYKRAMLVLRDTNQNLRREIYA